MTDQNKSSPHLPDDMDVLKARILELERKVSDAESVRESLAVSEAKYKTIIDNLKDIIFTNDPNGIVTYVTTSVGQYGYNPQDILGRNMLDFVHPDDWQLAIDIHSKLMSGSSEVSFEIRMLTKDGQVRVIEDCAKNVMSENGKVIGTVGVLRDITEKKAAEEALETMNRELEKYVWQRTMELTRAHEALQKEGRQRKEAEVAKDQSEHLLAEMINFLPDPTFVIDQNSCVLVWNQAMEQLTGILAKDILGKGNYEYSLPFYGKRHPILIDFALNPKSRIDKAYTGIRQQGDTFIAEAYTPRLKDGQPVYLWGIAKPYYDAQGEVLGAIESIRDVTTIHHIGAKLGKEVDKFRALYDLALNMSAEKSLDDNLNFIVEKSRALMETDAAYIALIDETKQCLIMHTLSGIRTEAFKKMHIPPDRGLGGVVLKTREGSIIDDYFNNDKITPADKDAVRKEGLASTMAVPICAAEKSLGVLYVSNRRKTSFTRDDLETLLLFGNLAAVEIVRKRAEDTTRRNAERIGRQNAAIMRLATDETIATGDVHRIFGMLTEAASEAVGADRMSVWLLSEDGDELHCADLYEASKKTHVQGMTLQQKDYPDYFNAISTIRKIIADDARGNPHTREFTDSYLVPLGITSMLDTGIHVAGRLVGVVCFEHTGPKRKWQGDEEAFANTVSALAAQALVNAERHKAENDLRESEKKYRLITERMIDIVWVADMNLRTIYITPSVKAVLGFSQEELPMNADEQMTPESLAVAAEILARELACEEEGNAAPDRNVTLVLEYYHRDGSTRWLETLIGGLRNEQGKLTGFHGVSRDITKRKLMEEELHESRKRLEKIIEFLPDATLVIDQEGRVIAWNQAIETMTGVKKEDMISRGDYEYALPFYGARRPILIDYALHPNPDMEKRYSEMKRMGDILFGEALTPNLHPGNIHLAGTASVLHDSRGNVIAAIECIRDVTHIKETELKLNNELSKFRALYDLALNMSAEKSLDDNLNFIVEKSRALMETDAAYIALIDEGTQCLVMHTLSGIRTEAFKKMRIPLDRGPGGLILKTREGSIIDDYFNNDEISQDDKDTVRGEGLTSTMAVPICAAEKSLGVLFVSNRRKTSFSKDDLETLLLFGNLAAVEIVRKRAESELLETASKYRTVFETTGSAMVILEENGMISLVNKEFTKLTGFPKEDIEGKKFWKEFIVPEDIPRLKTEIRNRFPSYEEPVRQYEYRLQDREGRQKNIFLTADLIPGTRKGVASLVDITKRKKAEEELKKAHDELESRVAHRTQQLTTANEGLKELLQKQDVNIDLAKNILAMINPRPNRHMFIDDHTDLFFTAFYLPCYAEGGDHFFIKNFSDRYPGIHKTAISLKDQSGHEVSCILRSIITDLIHNALLVNTPDLTLEERITHLNKTICGLPFFGEQNFFTAINTEFDHANLNMRYVSAGHPPFLLIRGQEVACLPALDQEGRNVPAGILGTIHFTAGEIKLQKGDKLIFYTDGFTDIPRRLGEPVFNADDLREMTLSIIQENQNIPVSLLIARLFNRINGLEKNDKIINFQGFDDDITLLGLELEDHLHEFEDIIQPRDIDDFSSCVTQLYRKIKEEWQEKKFPAPDTRLQMVLEEALTNAWKHGNQASPSKRIIIRRRYANDAVLEVIDEGNGFDFETFYDPTSRDHILQEHGRGNFIMRVLAEEIIWKEGGRHLLAFFSRQGADIHQRTDVPGFDLWKRMKRK